MSKPKNNLYGIHRGFTFRVIQVGPQEFYAQVKHRDRTISCPSPMQACDEARRAIDLIGEPEEVAVCDGGFPRDPGQPYCVEQKCKFCCTHDQREHGICLDCEHETDPGEMIDRAMDKMEDR